MSLAIVGRNPSKRLIRRLARHPEVLVTGRVEDVRPHVEQAAAYIIPLRIGGGTRIKAYEAMVMGKAVVSTPVGVEGLPVHDREHVILSAQPDEFVDAVVDLLLDPSRRQRLGLMARRFVENGCSWRSAAAVFEQTCRAVAGTGTSCTS